VQGAVCGQSLVGSAVLAWRGGVPFVEKARRAQAAGAAALVVVNTGANDELFFMQGHRHPDGRADEGDDLTIAAVSVQSAFCGHGPLGGER
jgi:hypothetical protein